MPDESYRSINVLILAGQRPGVTDPLCQDAGVPYKAFVPLLGRMMIDYVTEALERAELKAPYYVSGLPDVPDPRLMITVRDDTGPAGSVVKAIEEGGLAYPVLVTTCDHPLLKPEMIVDFIQGARESGADFCVGLAEKNIVQTVYPHVRRTYLKFSDMSVSGCNLFFIANPSGLRAVKFWQRAQHLRKKPLRLASKIGWGALWRYITGSLTLDGAFNYGSQRLAVDCQPVLLNHAEAAIDVDKPSDKRLVENILAGQG